jgi:hypothetical protein
MATKSRDLRGRQMPAGNLDAERHHRETRRLPAHGVPGGLSEHPPKQSPCQKKGHLKNLLAFDHGAISLCPPEQRRPRQLVTSGFF